MARTRDRAWRCEVTGLRPPSPPPSARRRKPRPPVHPTRQAAPIRATAIRIARPRLPLKRRPPLRRKRPPRRARNKLFLHAILEGHIIQNVPKQLKRNAPTQQTRVLLVLTHLAKNLCNLSIHSSFFFEPQSNKLNRQCSSSNDW